MRKAYLGMIKAYPGGWDAMAAALGMTRDALENRIYERKGQGLLVETAQQMQAFSKTTHFAEAVAVQSGGFFFKLPEVDVESDRDDLLTHVTALISKVGKLNEELNAAIADGEVDGKERARLNQVGSEIHSTTASLLSLTFNIFCRDDEHAI